MLLNEAVRVGQATLEQIKCAVARACIAGSVRRQKANVKDIEIVAIVNDYDVLFRRLAPLGRFIKPGVSEVIDWPPKRGAKYIRMLLNEGVKLDLFIATTNNWGGILTQRTGSGIGSDGTAYTSFAVGMFSRWKRVSQGGMMRGGQPMLPDGTLLEVPEEEDFFRLCEVEWVAPEDRTDRKAIKHVRKL